METAINITDQNPPKALVHVDLDGASHIYRYHGWRYDSAHDPIFKSGMKSLLDALDRSLVVPNLVEQFQRRVAPELGLPFLKHQ